MTRKDADTRSQRERFTETARALGADEDEAAFKEKLRVIARQKPKDGPKNPRPIKDSSGKPGKNP